MHNWKSYKVFSFGLLILLALSLVTCAGYRPSTYSPHADSQVVVTLDSATVMGVEIFDFTGKRVRTIAPDTLSVGLNVIDVLSVDDMGKPLRAGNYLYHFTYPATADFSALSALYLDGRTIPDRIWGYTNDSVPNPFSPISPSIHFHLDSAEFVQIRIYNTDGELVRDYPPKTYAAGEYDFSIDALDNDGERFPTGVYFCKITSESGLSIVKKLVFLR